MKAPMLRRHRVERFAQLLDEAEGARHRHAASPLDDDLAAMVALAARLSASPSEITPSDQWRRATRSRLLDEAVQLAGGPAGAYPNPPAIGRARVGTLHRSAAARRSARIPRQRSSGPAVPATRRRRIKLALLAGLAVSTLAVSGISAASGGALPGDMLYSMKRAAEQAQIDFGGSDAQKGSLYLQDAQRRLSEAQRITPDGDLVIATLSTMDTQARQGVVLLFGYALTHRDTRALATVNAFAAAQDGTVRAWQARFGLPEALDRKLTESGVLLDRIQERSREIAAAIACASTPYTIGTDDLGTEPGCRT